MSNFLIESAFFGFLITIAFYQIGLWIKNKTKLSILNPLLTSSIAIIIVLVVFKIDYNTYNKGAQYISYFLTPTTVCLAVPLYKQISKLKDNILAIISGILAGSLSNALVVVGIVKLFKMPNEIAVSLLPKSVTTPIAIGISGELGGITSITIFAVILSGVLGATLAPLIFKVLRINNKLAQGLACGTASHGAGTSTAMELGEIQGSISGLAIGITGIFTVVIAPIINTIFFL